MKIQKIKETLPGFDMLSNISLEYIPENEFITRLPRRVMAYFPLFDVSSVPYNFKYDVIRLEKIDLKNVSIVGIDTSIVPLAESVKGILYALRGAAVYYHAGSREYSITVFGPDMIYYTPEIVEYLHRYVRLSLNSLIGSIYDVYISKKIILSIYELDILTKIVDKELADIIVLDGTLESPIVRQGIYHRLLKELADKDISVLGISKRSRLIKRYFEEMIYLKKLQIDGFIKLDREGNISTTYIGYFNVKSGFPFRVDISNNSNANTLNYIYSSPSNGFGYPSVLIEAHTISKLKYKDVIGLFQIIIEKGGFLKSSIPHRSAVLGPLEGGMHETF